MAVTLTPSPEDADRYRRAGLWRDELIDVQTTSGTNDVVLATRHGLSVRFHESELSITRPFALVLRSITYRSRNARLASSSV